MNVIRVLAVFAVLFAGMFQYTSVSWAGETTSKIQATSPQRQMTGTGTPAGAAAGQTTGKKGFLSRELILGAIALAALAAVALESSTDDDKVPGPGATTPTTTTTTSSGG